MELHNMRTKTSQSVLLLLTDVLLFLLLLHRKALQISGIAMIPI